MPRAKGGDGAPPLRALAMTGGFVIPRPAGKLVVGIRPCDRREKPNMKRTVCVILAALLCAVALTGCAGVGDWASEPLVGNYEIWRSSAHIIELVERDGPSSAHPIIRAEIYAVAWNDDYIWVQHEDPEPDREHYNREPHGELDYQIFVVATGQVLGPFREADFESVCRERGIPVPEVWTPVRDLPRQKEG